MEAIASKYWELGLATLPTKEDKSPTMPWKGGVNDISKYNAFGIGVVCGEASGNLECLDFDNHFGDAVDNIKSFIEEIRDIYDLHKFPIQSTKSGGFHLLFDASIECDSLLKISPGLPSFSSSYLCSSTHVLKDLATCIIFDLSLWLIFGIFSISFLTNLYPCVGAIIK